MSCLDREHCRVMQDEGKQGSEEEAAESGRMKEHRGGADRVFDCAELQVRDRHVSLNNQSSKAPAC